MKVKNNGLVLISVFVIGVMILSACTQSYSQAPAATPTLLPTGLFVSPFPSVENPMAMIEEFAKGTATAAANTALAGGAGPLTTGTPGAPILVTDTPNILGITSTPQGNLITPTNAIAGGITPGAVATTAVIPVGPSATLLPAGVRPASYTLQSGEHPYCIARRFNTDPTDLLAMNGLVDGQIYPPGTVLKIPQSGTFPSGRALLSHPATYTVTSADETIFGIACQYGDVDPAAIATANGLQVSAKLTAGQIVKIP